MPIFALLILIAGCNNNNRTKSSATAPETFITAAPHELSNVDFAIFVFSCDQGNCQFECSLDGSGWSSCTSGQAFKNFAEGSHTFEVRAIKHGKRDPTPASFIWTIDLSAPDTILTKTPLDQTSSKDADFEFVCDAITCVFECQLDSGGWIPCSSPQTYNGLAEGSHTFDVRAIDAANNADPTPASFNWTIDITPPDALITSHPSNPSNATDAIFNFSCTESSCIFECQLDSGGWNSCSSGTVYSSLSGGSHLFEVRAIDSVGNIDQTPASYAWNINPPPDTIITSHPPDSTNSGGASFSFNCDQPPCTFECNLDSAGWSACSSPETYGTDWIATSSVGAPSARYWHTAVWTGAEMIIWGGFNGASFNTGGRYNPATDSWIATSTTNAPAGTYNHTAVWTGAEMIVWGGSPRINTGGRYNPATDSWIATSITNAPDVRDSHTSVWTGTEMIIWGGWGLLDFQNTGGRYSPAADSWIATSITNAPEARDSHSAVWTGSEMIIWGGEGALGFNNTGGRYNPGTDSWIATSLTNAPANRYMHTARSGPEPKWLSGVAESMVPTGIPAADTIRQPTHGLQLQ
jgi:hypothetical protein